MALWMPLDNPSDPLSTFLSRVLLGMLAVCSVILVPSLFVRERAVVSAVATWSEFWLVRLAMNLLGYATVAVPIFLMVHYLKRNKYNEIAGELMPIARWRVEV